MGSDRQVIRVDRKTKEEKIYINGSTAAIEVNGRSANILAVCKGNRKSAYGYLWKYVLEEDLEGEEWRVHPIHTDLKLSNHGRVQAKNGRKTYGSLDRKGYRRYTKSKTFYSGVHRLVAETFLFEELQTLLLTYAKPVVHHKDRNRQNNSINNLQWCTQKENVNEYHKLIPKLY